MQMKYLILIMLMITWTGTLPWCRTDGYSAQCFYPTYESCMTMKPGWQDCILNQGGER